MTTPGDYPYATVAGLWGGVRDDIQNGIDFTGDCAQAMASGMAAENRRRQLASQAPGLGALLPLPQPPGGPAVGKAGLDLPVVGEGFDTAAEVSAAVQKAYGEARPVYAPDAVGGRGYADDIAQPARRGVFEVEGRVFAEAPGRADSTVLISPATVTRRNLLGRLLGRFRR